MKKPKVSLDASKLKDVVLEYGDKVLLVLFAGLCLWLAYGAVTREKFNRQPKELADLVTQANQKLQSSKWTPDPKLADTNYAERAHEVRKPAEIENLVLGNIPLAPPVAPVDTKRGEPVYLAPIELQATAEFGGVAVKGTSGRKGYSWVVITGLIPFADQQSEFLKELGLSSYQGKYDTPTYVLVEVQRAESPGNEEDKDLKWERVASRTKELREEWSGEGKEVVDAEFLVQSEYVVEPLAPLDGKKWGDSASHPKFLFSTAAEATETPAEEENKKTDGQPDVFGERTDSGRRRDAAPRSSRGTSMPADSEQFRNRASTPSATTTSTTTDPKRREAQRYRLLRFFDYTAEQGRSYRYRVRLLLWNPNYEVPASELKDPSLATNDEIAKPYGARGRLTPFGKPSSVVYVPRPNNVLAGKAKAGRGAQESTVSVVLRQFDLALGDDIPVQKEMMRGQMANYAEKVGDSTVNFQTDSLLLDIIGGDALRVQGKNDTVPSLLVFYDPDGRLVVHSEIAEANDYAAALGQVQPAETMAADTDSDKDKDKGKKEPEKGLRGFQRGFNEKGLQKP